MTFFKNAVFQIHRNLRSNKQLSILNNIILCLLLFIGVILISCIAYIPIIASDGFDEYAGWGFLVVLIGLFSYLFLLPVMLLNIIVIYFLNERFGAVRRSFQTVLSDHTTIWISTFLLYSIGLYFYSLMETFRPYLTLAGTSMIVVSIAMYLRRLIVLVNHYIKGSSKKVAALYAILLVVTVLLSCYFFLTYALEGSIIEQLLMNIRRLFEDL